MRQDFKYQTKAGNTIDMSLYGQALFGERPCLLYIHGFKGFKDWGFVPYMAQQLVEADFACLTFNFSHNGIGPDGESFTELEKFSQNTFSLEISETLEMIHLLAHTDFLGRYSSRPIGLIGHSRGGGIAILSASQSRDVKALATWSSVAKFNRFTKAEREVWKKQGYREVVNSRTGQIFRMGLPLLEDIEKNHRKKLNIQQAVRELEKPLLLVHGAADETVPYFESEELNIFSDPVLTELRLIPGGTHTFGTKHPFSGSNSLFDLVLNQTLDFFKEQLI